MQIMWARPGMALTRLPAPHLPRITGVIQRQQHRAVCIRYSPSFFIRVTALLPHLLLYQATRHAELVGIDNALRSEAGRSILKECEL